MLFPKHLQFQVAVSPTDATLCCFGLAESAPIRLCESVALGLLSSDWFFSMRPKLFACEALGDPLMGVTISPSLELSLSIGDKLRSYKWCTECRGLPIAILMGKATVSSVPVIFLIH